MTLGLTQPLLKDIMSNRQYKVTPKFRTNSLHERGKGYIVTVVYKDLRPSKCYENVQYPEGYIRKIKEGADFIAGEIEDITYHYHSATKPPQESPDDLPF
jgi:hypothetical protein